MAFTADEQKIYDFVKGALPDWAFSLDGIDEFMGALVKAFDAVRGHRALWLDQAFISTADDGPPDWLNEHAKDRDTRRQTAEDNTTLRARLRTYADAVTRPALLAATQAILDANGVAGTAKMVDVRRDGAHAGTFTEQTGTGGTIATVSGTTRKFTPTAALSLPVEVGFARSGAQGNPRLVISGAGSAGNNGTFTITDLDGNGLIYTNATAVAAAPDATLTWKVRKYDVSGNVMDGKARAYWGRGYRYYSTRASFVVILPYGTPAGVATAVRDMFRQIKAAGVSATVEVRANP